MAPVQNTFSIIPNFPSAANSRNDDESTRRGNRPAMTTKQAKKAYQNATRGPKLTKAEIRRQELLEQDRIRKEAEKERNQTRAARARDRKREKEDNERAQKKKKGLPLVNVRPSQGTIAGFVRGFGAPKKATASSKPSPAGSPIITPIHPPAQSPGRSTASPPSQSQEKPVERPSKQSPAQPPPCSSCSQPRRTPIQPHDMPSSLALPGIQSSSSVSLAEACTVLDDLNTFGTTHKRVVVHHQDEPSPKRQRLSQTIRSNRSPDLKPGVSLIPLPRSLDPPVAIVPALPTASPPPPPLEKPLGDAEETQGSAVVALMTLSQELEDIAEILNDDYMNDSFSSIFSSPQAEKACSAISQQASTKSLHTVPVKSPRQSPSDRCNIFADENVRTFCGIEQPLLKATKLQALVSTTSRGTNMGQLSNRNPLQPLSKSELNNGTKCAISSPSPATKQVHCKPPSDLHAQPRKGVTDQHHKPMAPPPVPLKQRAFPAGTSGIAAKNVIDTPRLPTTKSIHNIRSGAPSLGQGMVPPPSTQAFMFHHVDDFFPSPSQELSELYADHISPVAVRQRSALHRSSNTQAATRASSSLPKVAPRISMPISQPGEKPYALKGRASVGSRGMPYGKAVVKPLESAALSSNFDFPFLSTQDVCLSLEDIEEFETPVSSIADGNVTDVEDETVIRDEILSQPTLGSTAMQGPWDGPGDRKLLENGQYNSENLTARFTLPGNVLNIQEHMTPLSRTSINNKGNGETLNMVALSQTQRPAPASASASVQTSPDSKHQIAIDGPVQAKELGPRGGKSNSKRVDDQPPESRQAAVETPTHHKPFFTSSCKESLYKYAIERTKTTAWGKQNSESGCQPETGLDQLQKLENDRFASLLQETGSCSQWDVSCEDYFSDENDELPGTVIPAQTVECQSGSSTSDLQQDKAGQALHAVTKSRNTKQSQRPGRPLNSYEKMLAELDKGKKHNMDSVELGNAETCPSASQETDYGDVGWDEEMLAIDF